METMTLGGVVLRLVLSGVLVLATFNPSGRSFYHWLVRDFGTPGPLLVLAGLVLLIGWIVLLRSMLRSIGVGGAVLTMGLLAALTWLVVSWGWLDPHNATAMTWVVLVALTLVLTTGLIWSHLRRRLTGQADVDEVDSR